MDSDRGPVLPVQSLTNDVLDLGVAECLRLPDEERQLGRELATAIDDAGDCVRQVLDVNERLAGAQHPWIKVSCEPMLINSSDLFGDEGRMAEVVVDAGDAQEYGRDAAAPLAQRCFRSDL